MLNHNLQHLLQKHPNLEVYIRIGEEVYRVDEVLLGQVVEDCGKLSPWHGGSTYQPGEKKLVVLVYADP